MKKFLALMLSLALVFALAACGQKDTGDSNTTAPIPTPLPIGPRLTPVTSSLPPLAAALTSALACLLPTGRRQLTIKPSSR